MLIAIMATGTRHPRPATPIATPLQPSMTAFCKARARCMVVPYTIRPPPRPRQARQHPVSRPAIVVATPACSERSETTWQASTHEETDKHGHCGQSTDRSAAVEASRWREVATAASYDSHFCFPQEALSRQPSSPCLVRSVRDLSVLHLRNYQNRMPTLNSDVVH